MVSPSFAKHLRPQATGEAREAAESDRETLLKRERATRADAEASARELMQVNAELEQFAYAASHVLHEPLNGEALFSIACAAPREQPEVPQ